ncbi:JAB domain-containing protein [Flavobacterium oreochromis]|uniref:JAB domain-containing protein n=1 Tax=Flavobacterium oreochromis TaxID=2906078 RepID=UPI00385CEB15
MEMLKKFEIKKTDSEFEVCKIKDSKSSYDFIRQFYGDDMEIYESVFILLLNNANDTIGYAKISQGGIVGTVVDVRLILKYAVEGLAFGVILAHNHPSGKIMPSEADISLTKKVKNALDCLDILLLDHIILTSNNYYSFADENVL